MKLWKVVITSTERPTETIYLESEDEVGPFVKRAWLVRATKSIVVTVEEW